MLRHQANVGHCAHGARIEVAVGFAEINDFLVDAGKCGLRNNCFGVLGFAVSTPHLAANANHGGHGGVNDHVVGRMQVGDAFGGINHGQIGAVLVTSVQVANDFVMQRMGQCFYLLFKINHTVVDIDTQLFKNLSVLFKGFFVENFDSVSKHDGVRDFHHGGFDVQREHHARFAGVFHLLFVKLAQGLFAHVHAVDDLARLQRDLGFQDHVFA